jgi:hypothetical protein
MPCLSETAPPRGAPKSRAQAHAAPRLVKAFAPHGVVAHGSAIIRPDEAADRPAALAQASHHTIAVNAAATLPSHICAGSARRMRAGPLGKRPLDDTLRTMFLIHVVPRQVAFHCDARQ